MSFFGPVASVDYIKSGKLLALAVTSPKRLDALPEVPSVSEFVPGFEFFSWFGVGAPRNTPKEVIEYIEQGDHGQSRRFDSQSTVFGVRCNGLCALTG